ncbi:hypothetical protein [Deinococcus daejeonensis]|uniref:Uncharacterized protein n=1 Tax=Deinococcus daejeonensis TaxID=1007098 RepID=A0ABQ2IU01_9DEIO|nr:hypothetical protein [Deinococcus daejeonensis]GGN30474.1 hypothetical protein GCM10010842_05790 [Deinococcus daejeonensis]
MTRPPPQRPPDPPPPPHLDLTLDLRVLNDENFARSDATHHASHTRLPLLGRPHTHRQYVRLGGSRTLTLNLHCPPVLHPTDLHPHTLHPHTLHVEAVISETRPAPARARHHATIPLRTGPPTPQHLPLHLPGDPHPYAHLTLRCTLVPAGPDPGIALHARACSLGWTPTHLHAVPGGHQLTTDHGALYHDGHATRALHHHADTQYHACGGPCGPLGLPTGDALTSPGWTLTFAGHTLRHDRGHTALLTRAAAAHWPAAGAILGLPVADTTRLDRPPGPLDVTPCEHGTLLVDPNRPARITPRTLRVPPARVTRWLQAHLDPTGSGEQSGQFSDPWPGQPLRYPLTIHTPGGPLTLCVPLALKISPTPDARRETHLNARQAGVIDLPPGTPARAARHALRVLDDLLRRPPLLATLGAGHHLIGAHVTPDGGLHLDFLPTDWT